jgi:hypothetical protein
MGMIIKANRVRVVEIPDPVGFYAIVKRSKPVIPIVVTKVMNDRQ